MNKSFIVMLAVCLVSAQAFVKRDAPADKQEVNYLDQAKAEWDKLGNKISETFGTFDSEKVQADLKKFMDDAAKALGDIGKKSEAPKN